MGDYYRGPTKPERTLISEAESYKVNISVDTTLLLVARLCISSHNMTGRALLQCIQGLVLSQNRHHIPPPSLPLITPSPLHPPH